MLAVAGGIIIAVLVLAFWRVLLPVAFLAICAGVVGIVLLAVAVHA